MQVVSLARWTRPSDAQTPVVRQNPNFDLLVMQPAQHRDDCYGTEHLRATKTRRILVQ